MIDFESIIAQALEALAPLVITILGVLILNFLKQRGVKEDYIRQIQQAYDLLADCIDYTNQVYVAALKAEGKFDKEAQQNAFKQTKARFMTLCSQECELAIRAAYNSLDYWLQVSIESDIWNANNTISAAS